MKKTVIAFDVDGTLIRNDLWPEEIKGNFKIRNLLVTLSWFKNVHIIVWSWRWEEWAELVVTKLWLTKYVDWVYSKNHIWKDSDGKHQFDPDIIPDICIDDIQDCNLWMLNLICKEK